MSEGCLAALRGSPLFMSGGAGGERGARTEYFVAPFLPRHCADAPFPRHCAERSDTAIRNAVPCAMERFAAGICGMITFVSH